MLDTGAGLPLDKRESVLAQSERGEKDDLQGSSTG